MNDQAPPETTPETQPNPDPGAARRRAEFEALDKPYEEPPAPGETIEVAPGVHWLRMPLPAALNHINLWLIEDGDGWAAVDCGFANDETARALGAAFRRDHGRATTQPRHRHAFPPRPFGPLRLALRTARSAAMDQPDRVADAQDADVRRRCPQLGLPGDFYRLNGLDPDLTKKMQSRGNAYKWVSVEAPHSFHRLADWDVFDIGGHEWRVVVGTGHTPEHVSLYCADLGVLISGDQILPRITPNITLPGSQPTTNPLDDYLTSLERFRGLMPDETLVLPSHIVPFRGLHRRIDQLADHHAERLKEIVDAVDRPMTAAQLLPVLFGTGRKFDIFEQGFAMGEALAHLRLSGETQGEPASWPIGDDGLIRYAPSADRRVEPEPFRQPPPSVARDRGDYTQTHPIYCSNTRTLTSSCDICLARPDP